MHRTAALALVAGACSMIALATAPLAAQRMSFHAGVTWSDMRLRAPVQTFDDE